jgi:hypothetical protein
MQAKAQEHTDMSDDELDKHLRAALRPVDPGEQFTRGVLSRITSGATSHRSRAQFRWRWAAALAAVMLGTVAISGWEVRRAHGLEARRQLIEALQVTGEKLDLASRAVNDSAGSRSDPGA